MALSPDGSKAVLGVQGIDGRTGQVLLLDNTGTVIWTRNVDNAVNWVDLSQDGSHIAAAGYKVNFTGLNTPDCAAIVNGQKCLHVWGEVDYLDRNGIQLWNHTLPATGAAGLHQIPSISARISADGSRVFFNQGLGLTVFDSQGHSLWSYSTGNPPNSGAYFFAGAFASADLSLVTMIDDRVRAFNSQGSSLWNSTALSGTLTGAVMSSDGKYFAAAVRDDYPPNNSTLYLFNSSGSILWARALIGATQTLVFSADDRMLVFQDVGTAAVDLQNRQLWNYSTGGANSLAVTSDGSYVVAGLNYQGQQILRFLNGQGNVVWGSVGYVNVRQVAISSDDSYTAVAYGPYATPSGNGAVLQFLPGPKSLASEKSAVYSFLYFDHDTNALPTILIVPAVFALIPLAILAYRWRIKQRSGQTLESSPTRDEMI